MKNQSILKTKISLNKLFESIFDDIDVDDEIKKQDTYEVNYDEGKLLMMQKYFNSNINGVTFKITPKVNESAFETSDFDITVESASEDINEWYFIINDEFSDLNEEKTQVVYPTYLLPASVKLFGELIKLQNQYTNSNEKLFKCIKFLKKAGE